MQSRGLKVRRCAIISAHKCVQTLSHTRNSSSEFGVGGLSFFFIIIIGACFFFERGLQAKKATVCAEKDGRLSCEHLRHCTPASH